MQFTNPDFSKWKGKTKIYRFEAHDLTYPHCGFYMGFAGTAEDIITVAEFFTYPEEFKQLPKTKGLTGLILTDKQEIFVFDSYNKWLLVNEPFHAIGSGAKIAMGAMAAGSTPRDAIKHATRLDAFTGMGIKSYKL